MLQNSLYTLSEYGSLAAGLGLLVLGATILARGCVDFGLSEEITGFRALLLGSGSTSLSRSSSTRRPVYSSISPMPRIMLLRRRPWMLGR